MRKRPVILFVFSSLRAEGYIDAAKSKGYDVAIIREDVPKNTKKLFDYSLTANFDDAKSIEASVQEFAKTHIIAGVLCWYEAALVHAAYIREMLGLPGPSLSATVAARDKLLMRNTLEAAGVSQPGFEGVQTQAGSVAAAERIGYPVMLKPVASAKSFLVQRANNEQELKEAWKTMEKVMSLSRRRHLKLPLEDVAAGAGHNDPRKVFLIESLVEGKQHATTSYVSRGRVHHLSVTDLLTTHDMGRDGFNLVSRVMPSRLPMEQQSELMAVAEKAAWALKIDNSIIHPELVETSSGPMVLEVGARIGGYRAEMTLQSSGVNLYQAAIDLSVGEEPSLMSTKNEAVATLEVFPDRSGVVKSISGIEDVRSDPNLISLSVVRGVGRNISNRVGRRSIGAIFSVRGDDPATTESHGLALLKKIKYEVEK